MNDLKFTIRQLLKQPGSALAVTLTLAVGLGSATVVFAIARLKPGVSLAAAQAEMAGIAARLAVQYPETNTGWGASVCSLDSVVAQLERLATQPERREVAVASNLPLLSENMFMYFESPDRPRAPNVEEYLVNVTGVSADYFSVLRIPLRYGRSFAAGEDEPDSVIISESLARRHFPSQNPLGERISILGRARTIVGVAGDVRHDGVRRASGQQLYLPFRHIPRSRMFVVTRPARGRQAVAPVLRSVVAQMDAEQPLSLVRELEEAVGASLASDRLLLYLVGVFGGVAMTLAAVGVYGVIAYWVAQRSREIGVRLALGATAGDMYRLVFAQAARLTAAGLLLGLAGAWGTGRRVASRLYQVRATDPFVCGGSVLLLTVAAALACYLPARRAARIDPMVALRCE